MTFLVLLGKINEKTKKKGQKNERSFMFCWIYKIVARNVQFYDDVVIWIILMLHFCKRKLFI